MVKCLKIFEVFYMRVFNEGNMYFATSYREDEIKCLAKAKPTHLLTSFPMWSNKTEDKDLFKNLIERIGYQPEQIIVDSGSFTFRDEDYGLDELVETYIEMMEEDGKEVDLNNEMDLILFAHWWFGEFEEDFYNQDKNGFSLFQQYLNFLCVNGRYYDYCFSLDRMGDNEESLLPYRIMKALGFPVLPVYQAAKVIDGAVLATEDFHILEYYAKRSNYIGIGGTAISKVKGYTKQKRIDIIRPILERFPDVKFHLLGTLDPAIIEACPELYSFDGQCWLQKVRKEEKIAQTIKYLNNKMTWFNHKRLEAQQTLKITNNGQLEFNFAG